MDYLKGVWNGLFNKKTPEQKISKVRWSDVVDILVIYNVYHESMHHETCGQTISDPYKQMEINSNFDMETRRRTVIHEYLHALSSEMNLGLKEKDVLYLEDKFYKRVYPEEKSRPLKDVLDDLDMSDLYEGQ